MSTASIFSRTFLAFAFLLGGTLFSVIPVQASAESAILSESVVNLNTASSEDLQHVRGIGPALAERILFYREEHGLFKSVEEVTSVRGIGSAKYEKIKTQLAV